MSDEGVFVLCLAGRNEDAMRRLDQEFGSNSRVSGLIDHMNDLLAAADVPVHLTGGVTCLEALARGFPIVGCTRAARLHRRLPAPDRLRATSLPAWLASRNRSVERISAWLARTPSATRPTAQLPSAPALVFQIRG